MIYLSSINFITSVIRAPGFDMLFFVQINVNNKIQTSVAGSQHQVCTMIGEDVYSPY